ncbi:hypothetical protein LINGRAHAP2_LOCUS9391, partial [Linum grandiflorum]
MTVVEFIDHWINKDQGSSESVLYLKDWHFVKVLLVTKDVSLQIFC